MIFAFIILLCVLAALPRVMEYRRRPITGAVRAAAAGQVATLPNGKTYFEWHGPVGGLVAVCVHGVSTPSYVFAPLVARLTKMGFRVLTYDLYGRGLSARPAGAQSCAFFASQLGALLDDQGIDDVDLLVGYSMGGSVATRFTLDAPDRVDQLALIASAGLGARLDRYMEFVVKTPVIGDWLMAVVPTRFAQSIRPDLAGALPEHKYRGTLKSILSSYRWALSEDMAQEHRALGEAHVPVLAIWAEADDAIASTAAGRLAEANRAAFQDVIKGADHGVVKTHEQEICAVLREFLKNG